MRLPHGGVPPGAHPAVERSPLCAAPFVAMEFDPRGDVLACCANVLYPLGNVAESTLTEIWHGPRARQMRAALAEGDLSIGCSVCRHRLAHGNGQVLLNYYDSFPLRDDGEWPYSLQFSLHNTCNLECVMCGADRSSRIRTRRSELDPLPHFYGERFFNEIEPFLAHAGAVDFSGGEPFLVTEHWRIWDLLLGLDEPPLCSLTTNGTVWNERVEGLLESIDHHIAVSIDGLTKGTFEAIRVGADFDAVMANLDRFLTYTRERGTILTMSWSLLRANWEELGTAMRFCEERGIQIKVQTVIEPEFGLQRLPTDELRRVLAALECEDRTLRDELTINRSAWENELEQLRNEIAERVDSTPRSRCMEPPSEDRHDHVQAMVLDVEDRLLDYSRLSEVAAVACADLERWHPGAAVGSLTLDRSGVIVAAEIQAVLDGIPTVAANSPVDLVSHPLRNFLEHLEELVCGQLWVGEEFDEGDRLAATWWFGREVRDKSGLILRAVSVAVHDEIRLLFVADARFLPTVESNVTLLGSKRRDRPFLDGPVRRRDAGQRSNRSIRSDGSHSQELA